MWKNAGYSKSEDLESGALPLYPGMLESPDLRWAFIRKIYFILSLQLALTVVVALVVVAVRPISQFIVSSSAGLAVYLLALVLPLITLCFLSHYHQRHPVNLLLLGLFTVLLSFAVGLTCAFTSGKIILEAAILTAVVVVSLTAYTFWAARRGHDFSFLGPFLFSAFIMMMAFSSIQILSPLGKTSVMIYGGLSAIVYAGYILYETDNLIKRYTYDEYILAAVSLYLDILNLFLSLISMLSAADNNHASEFFSH
ncbi:protein LIFEGUARD 2-like [Curcuma longa]|uniref:protein LIFEGUARD 2-like n=1 Tax=Curcuma longa TaxID=136217 RepID=UPI003D9E290D